MSRANILMNAIRLGNELVGRQVRIIEPSSPHNGQDGTILRYNLYNDSFSVRLSRGGVIAMIPDGAFVLIEPGITGTKKRRTRNSRRRSSKKR